MKETKNVTVSLTNSETKIASYLGRTMVQYSNNRSLYHYQKDPG